MAQRMARLLHQAGAAQILTENPVAAYTAARYRTTSQEEDRIYGIQQMFNFRLGNST